MIRIDNPDAIYKTKDEKYNAVVNEIIKLHKKEQPVLVGTIAIDVSEYLSKKLKKIGIKHNVLNAKNHSAEAEIVANAGQKNGVTIATNMAGRGTDIVLGNGVKECGGLYILGTERHESRRIDNQLRGRSGRQGDEGESKFFLSLDDDLLRIFGGERITTIMNKMGIEKGEPIEHNLISKAIESAQKRVEGQNFNIRKQLIDYDDVMNQQREVIYKQRRQALSGENLTESVKIIINDISENLSEQYIAEENKDFKKLQKQTFDIFDIKLEKEADDIGKYIYEKAIEEYDRKANLIGEDFKEIERTILLQVVDTIWKDHLLNMDHLKEGIGLRGYAQQDPLVIYKKEAFDMFQNMIERIKKETAQTLLKSKFINFDALSRLRKLEEDALTFSHGEEPTKQKPIKRKEKKIGRNSPCPCGSGNKYKKCCG